MSGNYRLQRVLAAGSAGVPSQAWVEASARVELERRLVETFLSGGGAAYGFSTELGHLDQRRVPAQDDSLLKSHLIGPLVRLASPICRLVAACKAEQMHNGGTGVSLRSFESVLGLVGEREDRDGAWLSSYGSGDVVPAAWWASPLLGSFARGDAIALINGNFVSTAFGIAISAQIVQQVARLMVRLSGFSRAWPSARDSDLLVGYADLCRIVNLRKQETESSGQAPISLRDSAPIIAQSLLSVESLGLALERRLSSASANPLFVRHGTGVVPISQSGFLDPHLTGVLMQARSCLVACLGLAQRIVAHRCDYLERVNPDQRLVQPPKVANALIAAALQSAGPAGVMHGEDSHGIEDLRDLSLITAWSLQPLVLALQAVLDLVPTGSDPELEVESEVARSIYRRSLLGEVLNETGAAESLRAISSRPLPLTGLL